MASLQGSKSYLDSLPDEVVKNILLHTMENDYLCHLEQHVQRSLRAALHTRRRIRIDYRHNGTSRRLLQRASEKQVGHLIDWLVLNTTSRRIRDIGKPLFFAAKTFGMSGGFAERLRAGRVSDWISPAQQARALTYMRDVAFLDFSYDTPNGLVAFPRRVNMFPNLTRCTLVFGAWSRCRSYQDQPLCAELSLLAGGDIGGASEMPHQLRQLLLATGVPENLDLPMVLTTFHQELYLAYDYGDWLGDSVYPVLAFRAKCLKLLKDQKKP
ncbi:hypothetical protein F4677DRAFT_402620 [Hypoxylon crocopeplum]|nr:hypothetical protein F4677DRAFT_402620 [Hypoxylon crocopeplum]